MITTIQLNENVKRNLDRLKETSRETYEDVIVKLINKVNNDKKRIKELLIEGCKEMAEESLKITREFEAIEDFKDWEWDGDF